MVGCFCHLFGVGGVVKNKDVEDLRSALHVYLNVQTDGAYLKISAPYYKDRNGENFVFYAYRRPKDTTLYLTDAGLITRTLQKSGLEVNMSAIQVLLRSYQLMVMADGCVVENTKRPLGERVTALFQAWAAADGVMRTWIRPKKEQSAD